MQVIDATNLDYKAVNQTPTAQSKDAVGDTRNAWWENVPTWQL